jgi:heat shock protein HslJ
MKKYLVWSGFGVLLVGLIGATAYWFLLREEPKPTRGFRDRSLEMVPPVAFPMKGKTFVVPVQPDTTVTLNLVAPSTKRDYPMARFAIASGTGEGELYVMDDIATPLINNRRAVPLVVKLPGSNEQYYLALIDETATDFKHLTSLFLGESLQIKAVQFDEQNITVTYLVHDRGQVPSEIPKIETTAIIDMTTLAFIQEGRKPWLEVDTATREFTGTYWWQRTVNVDGSEITPSVPNTFSLIFDGSLVTLKTDCNTGSTNYTAPVGTSTSLTFGSVTATKMFCNSQEEGPYFNMVMAITAFAETADGNLAFTLSDGRTMQFVREGNTIEFETIEAATTP